jgi:glyoxylase-like metal-dependent hydrolase (beta-lactamase superfamily II)
MNQYETANLRVLQFRSGIDFATDDPIAHQMANYAYAVANPQTGQALVVDPAYAPNELVGALASEGYDLAGVLVTHHHADHIGGSIFGQQLDGLVELLAKHDVPVHVQRDEVSWIARALGRTIDALVAHDDGDLVDVGGESITLLHTPGHTPGSQCIAVNDQLLTGDTLFLQGCGRTDLPGGDADLLVQSLRRITSLPGDTVVLPGHAYAEPSALLNHVRLTNEALQTDQFRG